MTNITKRIIEKLDEMNIDYELEENKAVDRLTMETKDSIEIWADDLDEAEIWDTLDELEAELRGHIGGNITSYNDGFETRTTMVKVVA